MNASIKKRTASKTRPSALVGNDNGVKFRDSQGHGVRASKNFVLRLTQFQKIAYTLAAHRRGIKVAAWAKIALDEAAGLSYEKESKGSRVTIDLSGSREVIVEKMKELEKLVQPTKDDTWLLEFLKSQLNG